MVTKIRLALPASLIFWTVPFPHLHCVSHDRRYQQVLEVRLVSSNKTGTEAEITHLYYYQGGRHDGRTW